MTQRRATIIISAMLIALGTTGLASGASAEPSEPRDNGSTQTRYVTQFIPFDHAVTLEAGLATSRESSYPVTAIRFDNSTVVGEFAPGGALDVSSYLAYFEKTYATEPMAVGVNVTRKLSDIEQENGRGIEVHPLATDAPSFTAPAADTSSVVSHQSVDARSSTEDETLDADWRPNYGYFYAVNGYSGLNTHFNQYYEWSDGSEATQVPSGFGLEYEINLYAPLSDLNGNRPACYQNGEPNDNAGDEFWAVNHDWTWEIAGSTDVSNTDPYADYNDLEDECNRNSIAVGMRYPQEALPDSYGSTSFYVSIWANRGNDTTDEVGALVQPVSDAFCTSGPGALMSLTDCMGVTSGTWPSGVVRPRTSLNIDRGWTVGVGDDLCWISDDKGLTDPVAFSTC